MIDYKILIEIFGYIGTLLVIISMMMTSITKLRIVNIIGSAITVIYSLIYNTWPIVVMNSCLIMINVFHLIKQYSNNKTFKIIKSNNIDQGLSLYFEYNKNKIMPLFSKFLNDINENFTVYTLYKDYKIIGFIIGTQKFNIFDIDSMFFSSGYKNILNKNFLLECIKKDNINAFLLKTYNKKCIKKIKRIGFIEYEDTLIKYL